LQRHVTNQTGLLHSTYRTQEEKRLLTNERARKKRANAKAAS
jgi:hypothetical protein